MRPTGSKAKPRARRPTLCECWGWLARAAVSSALLMSGHSASAAPVVEANQKFVCHAISVWDGDGPIWCREGYKIRLAGIATREIDGSCRVGQPCPGSSGPAARAQLVGLLGGAKGVSVDGHISVAARKMSCLSTGHAKGDRTGAWCWLADGRNLSCVMIASGTALRWARFDPHNMCCSGGLR
jgi:endonuclease YncB( thermonuclease family)